MLFSGIHHVAIICSNYEISKHFYTKILNFKVVHEVYREDRQSYKLNLQVSEQTQIELFSFEHPPKRPTYPEACGLRHLAFRVEDIFPVLEYLKVNGIKCEPIRIDEYTSKRYTFFSDPDGLPLEIYEEAI